MISIIACVGKNNELGKDNKLCFNIKEDMEFFKRMTRGKIVLMGRKTYESIGHPLKGRINCVLTSRPSELEGNVLACVDIDAFLENCRDDVFVIGGASVYVQALPYAKMIYLTEVEAVAEADAFFPEFDKSLFDRRVLKTGDKFEIVKYTRRAK